MKTLAKTLLAVSMTSLLATNAFADETEVSPQVQSEYTYQYEKVQGELSGARQLDRDREQDRIMSRTHDPKREGDQPAYRYQHRNQYRNIIGEQDGELVQERLQHEKRLQLEQEQAQSSQSVMQSRNQHRFDRHIGSNRMSSGSGKR